VVHCYNFKLTFWTYVSEPHRSTSKLHSEKSAQDAAFPFLGASKKTNGSDWAYTRQSGKVIAAFPENTHQNRILPLPNSTVKSAHSMRPSFLWEHRRKKWERLSVHAAIRQSYCSFSWKYVSNPHSSSSKLHSEKRAQHAAFLFVRA